MYRTPASDTLEYMCGGGRRGVCVCVEEECGCVEGETQNKVVKKPWVSLFQPCAVCDIEDLQFP